MVLEMNEGRKINTRFDYGEVFADKAIEENIFAGEDSRDGINDPRTGISEGVKTHIEDVMPSIILGVSIPDIVDGTVRKNL